MSASYHSESKNSSSNLDDKVSSPNSPLTRATTALPSSTSDLD